MGHWVCKLYTGYRIHSRRYHGGNLSKFLSFVLDYTLETKKILTKKWSEVKSLAFRPTMETPTKNGSNVLFLASKLHIASKYCKSEYQNWLKLKICCFYIEAWNMKVTISSKLEFMFFDFLHISNTAAFREASSKAVELVQTKNHWFNLWSLPVLCT